MGIGGHLQGVFAASAAIASAPRPAASCVHSGRGFRLRGRVRGPVRHQRSVRATPARCPASPPVSAYRAASSPNVRARCRARVRHASRGSTPVALRACGLRLPGPRQPAPSHWCGAFAPRDCLARRAFSFPVMADRPARYLSRCASVTGRRLAAAVARPSSALGARRVEVDVLIPHRFGDMLRSDPLRPCQVGDGPRHPQHGLGPALRETAFLLRCAKQPFAAL